MAPRRSAGDLPESASALLATLAKGAAWAAAMVRDLGGAATLPGPDGGWTPVRVAAHLVAVDAEVWAPRVAQLAAHEHPTWAWTEPSLEGLADPSPDTVAAALTEGRARLLETVAAMDEAAMACTGLHATFGELDIVGLLGQVVRHDAEHLASLAEAVAARSNAPAESAGAGHG